MAQHDYVIDNSTGANVRADINSALQAIVTNNSGSSAPSATFPFMLFADTSAGTMKIRNAADNAFIELFQLDGTFTLEDGSASTPALAFRDDLNTGIFQPGNNQVGISCNGTEVVEFGTAEVVFNDTGADINFRVEGDTDANLINVDAGNDRIGIGTSTPSGKLDIQTGTNGNVLIDAEGGSNANHARIVNDSGDLRIGAINTSADTKLTSQRHIQFLTGSSEAEHMRLESDGDLRLSSDNAATNYGFIDGWTDSTGQMQIGSDHGTTGTGTNVADIIFKTRGSEKLRISHGGGITFNGDTAAANRLEGYEEGTWTPTNNSGVAHTTHNAHYVKVGSMVICQAYISFGGMSGTNELIIGGFPFSTATNLDFHACAVNSGANLGSGQLVGQFVSAQLQLAQKDNVKATPANLSGGFIVFSVVFHTV